jgi:serine/threonine-protein phosphatase 5
MTSNSNSNQSSPTSPSSLISISTTTTTNSTHNNSTNNNNTPQPPTSPPTTATTPSLNNNNESVPEACIRLKDEGNELFKNKHYRDAVERYSDAISILGGVENEKLLYPKSAAALYCNRSIAYIRTEAYGGAAADAKRAIELDPNNPKAYYRLGSAHVAMGKNKEALAVFKIVVKLSPNDKDAQAKLDACQKEVKRAAFEAAIATEATLLPSEKIIPAQIEVAKDYTGPRWDASTPELNNFAEQDVEVIPNVRGVGGITKQFVEDAISYLRAEKVLPKKYVVKLILAAKHLLRTQPSLIRITIPENATLTVCGDIHGQFYDLLNLFDLAGGRPSRENPYLFNGDFVDRGSFSVEVIVTLLLYKVLDPQSIYLLRGNHETVNMGKIYGFHGELKHKYDPFMVDLFSEFFRYLPLSATLNDKVIVMHGGLFQRDGVTLDEISKIPRFSEPPDSGLFSDILWSDPQAFPGRGPSKRGVGQSFGPDVTKRFLDDNGLELIVRSHEVRDEGVLVEHGGLLITVFSAPNYCDQMGNLGAFIKFIGGPDGKSIKDKKFTSFKAVPHPVVPPMAYAGNTSLFGL